MFESGIKLFDLGVKLFGLDVNMVSGQIYRKIFVVYTDEEKVYCRRQMPMTEFMHIRAETPPICTGVA